MNQQATAVLTARNLCLQTEQQCLLDNINLEVYQGELLGIIGPNGAGKSTLLKLLAGIEQASSGKVLCEAKELASLAPDLRARNIAWLEQRPVLHWPLSVHQVVALGRLAHRKSSTTADDAATIEQALEFTGITQLRLRLFPTLSEGEKLLVNLARVLASQSKVILADEPTSALDPRHQLQVMELLKQLAASGTAVVIVLHDLTLAARYCQRLLLLHKGSTQACGSPVEILTAELLSRVYEIDAYLDKVTNTVISKTPD